MVLLVASGIRVASCSCGEAFTPSSLGANVGDCTVGRSIIKRGHRIYVCQACAACVCKKCCDERNHHAARRGRLSGDQLPYEALEDDGAAGSAGLGGLAAAHFARTVAARSNGEGCTLGFNCECIECAMRCNGMTPRRRRPAQRQGVRNASAEQASGGDSECASTNGSAVEEAVSAEDTPLPWSRSQNQEGVRTWWSGILWCWRSSGPCRLCTSGPPMLWAPRALQDRQDAAQAQEEECASFLLVRSGQLLLRVPQEVGCVAEGCPEEALHDAGVGGEDVVGVTVDRGRQGHVDLRAQWQLRGRGQLVQMMHTGVCAAWRSSSFDFGMCSAVPVVVLVGCAHHRAS